MENEIQIGLASEVDAVRIASLIRESFSREVLEVMIYGCRGIENFVRQQISIPGALADTVYLVAVYGNRLAGCAELRWAADALFLNYICTHPEARSKGLAKNILLESIRIMRTKYHREMRLDVFENNITAGRWYERLGFRHDYTTEWWDISSTNPCKSSSGKVSGFPQASACQENYGFSMFRVLTRSGAYSVGLMGNGWFRVTQPDILHDMEALSTLHELDGKRKILALFPERSGDDAILSDARLILKTRRMSMELDLLQKNLGR